jgi:hypothetical protein
MVCSVADKPKLHVAVYKVRWNVDIAPSSLTNGESLRSEINMTEYFGYRHPGYITINSGEQVVTVYWRMSY